MSTVLKFEDVSKVYRLGEVGAGTVIEDLTRLWFRICGKSDPYSQNAEINDRAQFSVLATADGMRSRGSSAGNGRVWALRDVSFEVREGEILGLIGRNGAGKSTLLKILSRVTSPSSGKIWCRGRVASLLEVGTGFHSELSGRENIFLNGAILGMRSHETRRRLEKIVEFSGCGKYLDTPVKRYSSGMIVRLGFAVAAYLDCEILILDEVLAVGDAEFQHRCSKTLEEMSSLGRTIILVTHNLRTVSSLCHKAAYLDKGTLASFGNADTVLEAYKSAAGVGGASLQQSTELGSDAYPVRSISLVSVEDSGDVRVGCRCRFELSLVNWPGAAKCTITLYNSDGYPCATFLTQVASVSDTVYPTTTASKLLCMIEELSLTPDIYTVNFSVEIDGVVVQHVSNAMAFAVGQGVLAGRTVMPLEHGRAAVRHTWSIVE